MQVELVSAIATSSDSTSSTAAPPVATSTTNNSEICSAQPITPLVYSTSLGPPPLIPADTYSIDSQHRPIASTLFVPHSVYNLPINTQQQVPSNSLINASTVFTICLIHHPLYPSTVLQLQCCHYSQALQLQRYYQCYHLSQ